MTNPNKSAAYLGNPQNHPNKDNADTTDQIYPDDPFGSIKQSVTDPSPGPQVVNQFHKRCDKDSSVNAAHHTLGPGHNQASPGDHKHDGTSSKKLYEGITVGGSGSSPALHNLLTALGFTDTTTP